MPALNLTRDELETIRLDYSRKASNCVDGSARGAHYARIAEKARRVLDPPAPAATPPSATAQAGSEIQYVPRASREEADQAVGSLILAARSDRHTIQRSPLPLRYEVIYAGPPPHPSEDTDAGEIEATVRIEDSGVVRLIVRAFGRAYSYLCGECGHVGPADSFPPLVYDEEHDELIPAPDGSSDPIVCCPACTHEHRDDDSGAGLWSGTRFELLRERSQLMNDPVYAEAWSEVRRAA